MNGTEASRKFAAQLGVTIEQLHALRDLGITHYGVDPDTGRMLDVVLPTGRTVLIDEALGQEDD